MLVKICGITRLEDARAARQYGADMIGFVFADSRRRIEVREAARIAQEVRGIGKAGVFVDQPLEEVRQIAVQCQLDYIQLSGGEPAEYCRQLNRPVIKAVRIGSGEPDREGWESFPADWLLFDSFVPGQAGGSGRTFDWAGLREITRRISKPFLVAGGLNGVNVPEAINILRPYGVDVSSGVETDGVKDQAKIRDFILSAKAAKTAKEGSHANPNCR
ncbi:phosphoribosylanthranilate isomerase [Acetonema longum]|uniref:N-(5'-phosphoribosyl)anthranilate isomerase n=1 Tax=Acetonema longum DSM 6540 TaxID=1009370 RepID=F7NDQ0_9FIRM|nr:phosphoribosylanthranilate isomerase [Acetonema longum]EGO65819.1 N-(5'-phosphoribosyl)anthranilate isomerase [Acetonema longum DSM 6540]